MLVDRKLAQDVFIRICRDSGWNMSAHQAAHLAADVLGVSALEIGFHMPSMSVMDDLAQGKHPACA